MYLKNLFLLFAISFILSDLALSQESIAKKDSTHLYKKIESISKRSRFTKLIYPLFFKSVASSPSKKKRYKSLIVKPYTFFEGKTIRNINIRSLAPFGYSIVDTLNAPSDFFSKTGNSLHIKTLPMTIRNLLLVRENHLFDSLLVKESERLVRSKDYIRDVSFFVKNVPGTPDSVDIDIRVLDIWSLLPNGAVSTSGFTIDLMERNFLGLGHSFQNVYGRDDNKGRNSLTTNYSIPNFRNTFVGSNLHYDKLGLESSNWGFSVDRPFFSPFAKWAAGINIFQQFRKDSIATAASVFLPQRIRFNVQDYWAGHSRQLFRGNSEYERTTNFVTAIRFLRVRYLEKPSIQLDSLKRYADENSYLASFGISTRQYVQDQYIFKFGITEDVPIGKVFSLTTGYQVKNNSGRFYLGARISVGDYRSWGYLSSNLEYGTYLANSRAQEGILSAGLIYFTGLVKIGNWKFRQFVKPQISIGMNLFSYDTLRMNDGHGLDGFKNAGVSGTGRILLTMQTQSYSPWNLIGFRFGPFLNFTLLNILGDSSSPTKSNKIYSQIGLGVMIKNENLVLNTFQISIAFYPSIPGESQNVFKTNSFRTTDFSFKDFDIGKPGTVTFQ